MGMSLLRIIGVVLVVIAAIYLYAYLTTHGQEVDVSAYKGAGKIKSVSAGTSRGFEVEFDTFDISKSFEKSYKLDSLPNIKRDYYFFYRLYKEFDRENPKISFEGRIELLAKLSDGNVLFRVEDDLSNWSVTSHTFFKTTDLYYLNFDKKISSSFDSKELTKQPILVEFSYVPNQQTLPKEKLKASLVLRAGGSK